MNYAQAKKCVFGWRNIAMSLSLSAACQSIAPSVTLKMNAMVAQMRAQGIDVISLGAGEPDFVTPKHICDAAKRAIDEGKTHYTDAKGLPALRKALAKFIKNDKGLDYQADDIIVCTGAKQALLGALIAVCNPGDEVIVPAPCWISYPEMIRMAGAVPVIVESDEAQGFIPDIAQIAAAVTDKTKAIILNTPGNPGGSVWPRAQLAALAKLAVRKGFYIISDEIYEKLVYDGAEHVSVASLGKDVFAQTIMISGFSKAYAMTGWRIGYAAGPRAVIAAMGAYQSHATGNPNSIAQYAAIAALEGDQQCVYDMTQRFAQRRDLMMACIRKIPGVRFFAPKGAFYILLDVRPLLGREYKGMMMTDSVAFAQALLEDAQVSVVPGEPFYARGYVRLSYATGEERIMEALRRIAQFVENMRAAA